MWFNASILEAVNAGTERLPCWAVSLRVKAVVLFGNDLRVHDHRPLWEAAQRGPLIPLYVHGRSAIGAQQAAFVGQSLQSLRVALAGLGQPLLVRSGPLEQALSTLHAAHSFRVLHYHIDPYANDSAALQAWAQAHQVPFCLCF